MSRFALCLVFELSSFVARSLYICFVADKIQCETHGESSEAYVCNHLLGETAGRGFNRSDPSDDNPFPDAWCDDCEIIRAAHGGWNEESEKLSQFSLLCSGCYQRARIRNTRTETTLDHLANLRWKCGTCEEWHTGACLDFGHDSPYYWTKKHDEEQRHSRLLPNFGKKPKSFLNEDYCDIEREHFFVRGVIPVPIIGTAESFRWGVWGSLKRENFEKLIEMHDDPKAAELEPMFSWLSSKIEGYPDTLSLKMYAHIQKPPNRPRFELEPTDHPLAQEYHNGITPERVREIMMTRLQEFQG
jgi:hypothetical protein